MPTNHNHISTPAPQASGKSLADCLWDVCDNPDLQKYQQVHAKRLLSLDEYYVSLSKHAPTIKALEEHLNSLGYKDFTFIGAGNNTLVLGATGPDGKQIAVRIGGPSYKKSLHMPEIHDSATVAGNTVMIVERVTCDVTFDEARRFAESLYKEGKYISDVQLANLGRTKDGRIVAVDSVCIVENSSAEDVEKGFRRSINLLDQYEGARQSAKPAPEATAGKLNRT